jgi:hypothetical protein
MAWYITAINSFLGWWARLFSLWRWGCFLVWGVWFLSRVPLKGTGRM